MTSDINISPNIKVSMKLSRKESLRRAKSEKAKIRIEKKAFFRKKTEKKLVEKSKRKTAHKIANAQKKFQSKLSKWVIKSPI